MKIVVALIIFILSLTQYSYAEVCVSDEEAVDIASLLESSGKDLDLLEDCLKVSKELYKELEDRDAQVKSLTGELVEAKQDVIIYKASSEKWKKVAWYTTAAGIAIAILKFLPVL